MLLWGWRSQVYLKINLTMSVTVGLEISCISVEELRHAVIGWFEISCISKDELGHEYYCGVGDLKYI